MPDLLAKVAELDHRHLRILLLARTVGAWWKTLRKAAHVRNWVSREPSQLEQLGKEFDRVEVLRCAYRDFRQVIFPAAPEETPSVLIGAAPGEANGLSLHAAALAVVLHCRDNAGQPPQNTINLAGSLGDLLDHERNWWQMWIHSPEVVQGLAGLEEFDDHDFSNRVLIIPSLYQPTDETQAKAALVGVLDNSGFGAELASKVAATLPKVYPHTRTSDVHCGWGPLQPDRLCEELVLEVLGEATSQERCNELVYAIFTAGVDEAQAEKALIVLARASGLTAPAGAERATTDTALARQRASGCIRALLERYPDPFLPAATTVAGGLSEPAPLIDIIRSTLRCAGGEVYRRAARLIPETIPALAPLQAALLQQYIALALERSKSFTVSQELDLADNYHWLSETYERANDSNAALVAVQSAVERYRYVVSRGRADVRGYLANAQEALATREKDAGHLNEVLDQITRAIDTYQDLVDEDKPHHFELARAKGLKSRLLRDMGRHEEADRESNESRKPATEYQKQVEAWLAANLPQPVEDPSAHGFETALDRYGGPRPSFHDPNLRIVVPVGHFAGPMFTSPDAKAPESFEVRFRDGVFSLSAREYAVWAVTHGNPEIVGQVPSTRAVVEYNARQAGVEEPGPLFDSLINDGLLVEVAPEGESAREFARRHNILPLALGLGNTPQQLGGFQIGMPNAPRATVGYDAYHMWLFTHRALTLWDAVSSIASEAAESNAEEPAEGEDSIMLIDDPDVLLTGLLRALPVLISTSCVVIDRL